MFVCLMVALWRCGGVDGGSSPEDGAELQVQMASQREGIKLGSLLTSSHGGRAADRREIVSPRQRAKAPLFSFLLPLFLPPDSFHLSSCPFTHFYLFLPTFFLPLSIPPTFCIFLHASLNNLLCCLLRAADLFYNTSQWLHFAMQQLNATALSR